MTTSIAITWTAAGGASRTVNYQDRNTQSRGPITPVFPLPGASVDTAPPGVTGIITKGQGNWGTPQDGWDAVYHPMLAADPTHTTQINSMNGTVQKAAFTPGKISQANYHPIMARMAQLVPVGDNILVDYDAHYAGKTAPSPTGGGGGGGKPPGGGGGLPGKPVTTPRGRTIPGCPGTNGLDFPIDSHKPILCPSVQEHAGADVFTEIHDSIRALGRLGPIPPKPAKPAGGKK